MGVLFKDITYWRTGRESCGPRQVSPDPDMDNEHKEAGAYAGGGGQGGPWTPPPPPKLTPAGLNESCKD